MWARLQALDEAVFRAVNQGCAHPSLDWLFAAVSSQELFLPLIALAAIVLLLRGGARGRLMVVLAVLNLAIGDGLINQGIRAAVRRPRPHEALVGTRKIGWRDAAPHVATIRNPYEKPGGKSFPSGHMINNASIGGAAAWLYPGLAAPVAAWLVLMGVARVYTGAHYPSDVLGSIWIGLACSVITFALTEALWRFARKRWPRLARAPASLVALGGGRKPSPPSDPSGRPHNP